MTVTDVNHLLSLFRMMQKQSATPTPTMTATMTTVPTATGTIMVSIFWLVSASGVAEQPAGWSGVREEASDSVGDGDGVGGRGVGWRVGGLVELPLCTPTSPSMDTAVEI